jgi:hypothetical protein
MLLQNSAMRSLPRSLAFLHLLFLELLFAGQIPKIAELFQPTFVLQVLLRELSKLRSVCLRPDEGVLFRPISCSPPHSNHCLRCAAGPVDFSFPRGAHR